MTGRLHCFGESGNAYKAALTLTLAGVPWEPVFVDFFGGEARSPAFRALNPMGEVPVWVEGDLVLTQSGVIQMHAAEVSGRMGGESPAERREVLRWLLWDNHKMSSQAGALRFQMNFLPEDKRPAQVIGWLQGRFRAALQVLDGQLAAHDWVAGGAGPTLADCACAGISTTPSPSASTAPSGPRSTAGSTGWRPCRAGQHPYDMMPGRRGRGYLRGRHDRGLHLRRAPQPARPGPARRRPARGDGSAPFGADAGRRAGANGLPADAVEDVIWGNVTQVGEQGGCLARTAVLASGLGRAGSGPFDQPFLRERARGGEPCGQPGPGGRRRGLHRRRRRDDEPRAHGLRRRGGGGGPVRDHGQPWLRAAGHRRRPDRHRIRLYPRRLRRAGGGKPGAGGAGLGRGALCPVMSCR
jgi:glutathione S-transferase